MSRSSSIAATAAAGPGEPPGPVKRKPAFPPMRRVGVPCTGEPEAVAAAAGKAASTAEREAAVRAAAVAVGPCCW